MSPRPLWIAGCLVCIASVAYGADVTPACTAPDVIFQLSAAHLTIGANPGCGISFQEQVLPTLASDGFTCNHTLTLSSTYASGLTRFNFNAIDGHCDLFLETILQVSGGVPGSCAPSIGSETFGDPAFNGLSVYVRGTTGTHYWTRGQREGVASVTPNANVKRLANSVCCQASSGTAPNACTCDPQGYDQPNGIIGTTNGSVDAVLIYQGIEYHRVLRVRINNGCSGPAGGNPNDSWLAQTQSRYVIDAGRDGCKDFAECAWNSTDPAQRALPQNQSRNNCYNYATEHHVGPLEIDYAQIGRGSFPGGAPDWGGDKTPEQLIALAERDGLQLSDATSDCGGACKVALLYAPPDNWHWAKQHADGTWSHKPGPLPATNRDCGGAVMTSAEQAQYCLRGFPHYDVIAYFCVPRFGPTIHQAQLETLVATTTSDTLPIAPANSMHVARLCYPGLPDPFHVLTSTDSAEIAVRLQGLTPAPDPQWSWNEPFGPVFTFVNLAGGVSVMARDAILQLSDENGVTYAYDTNDLTGWAATHVPSCSLWQTSVPGSEDPAKRIAMSAYPNPASGAVRFSIDLNESNARLDIMDAAGRQVRTLMAVGKGHHSLEWDGQDQSGRRVPAGVYIGRLSTSQTSQYVKVTMVSRR